MSDKNTTRPTGRSLSVRVKTAKRRSLSSTLWLERQLNDPYVVETKRRGYRSRAAFKLLQLDERFHLLKPGIKILDLGAAPGGWLQVAIERTKPGHKGAALVGIDLLPVDSLEHVTLIQDDVLNPGVLENAIAHLGGKADLVMSDMAASTTGHARTDYIRTMALAEAAVDCALFSLAPNGSFVTKVFQGGAERPLLDVLRKNFSQVRHAKPEASRADSREMYLVAKGFRGA